MSEASKKYTLEEIRRQRQKLSRRIEKKEKVIGRKWHGLVAPPELNSKIAFWTNRAEAAYSLYDGFMMGYKLLRILGFSFGRKRKKK